MIKATEDIPGTSAGGEVFRFGPWSPRPAQRLLDMAPKEFWLSNRMLPVGLEGGPMDEVVVVATADLHMPARVLRDTQTHCRRPVRLVLAASDEMQFWLNVVLLDQTWSQALTDAVAITLSSLGTETHPVSVAATKGELQADSLSVGQVMDSLGLAEPIALEILALCARIPQVRPDHYSFRLPCAGKLLS